MRYFLSKKGSQIIFEVNKKGFSFKNPNYLRVDLKWKISGPLNDFNGISGIVDTNRRTILLKKTQMPFLDRYLSNLSEFARI